jgi:hypothetical protein
LVTLFFFIRPFRTLPVELRFIFFFVLVQFLTNGLATLLEKLIITNYSVYVANVILSFGILSALFYRLSNATLRKVIPLIVFVFLVAAVISIARGDGIASYNSSLSALSSFIITAYCLNFFYWRLVRDAHPARLTEGALFWIVIGIFTYYTGSFFIFISYKYLIVQESKVIGILWRFHNLLLTLFCLYTIYGMSCKNYQKT